jgi:hypothetical protein
MADPHTSTPDSREPEIRQPEGTAPNGSAESAYIRRRAAALTVIAALIVIPAAILLSQRGGGGGGTDTRTSSDIIVPQTTHSLSDKKAGMSISWPKDWTGEKTKEGAIRLVSKDKSTAVVLIAFPSRNGKDAAKAFRSEALATRDSFKHGKLVVVRHPELLSGLHTASGIITGTNKKGSKQRVVLIVARGKRHVYAFETLAPASGGRLGDVAVISRSLKLTG